VGCNVTRRTSATSSAPAAFATDVDAFIGFLDLERGLALHTRESSTSARRFSRGTGSPTGAR